MPAQRTTQQNSLRSALQQLVQQIESSNITAGDAYLGHEQLTETVQLWLDGDLLLTDVIRLIRDFYRAGFSEGFDLGIRAVAAVAEGYQAHENAEKSELAAAGEEAA
jgi:hypothetical protein